MSARWGPGARRVGSSTRYEDGEDFLPFDAASSRRIALRRYAGAAL